MATKAMLQLFLFRRSLILLVDVGRCILGAVAAKT
jgi:hypothetical protein